MRIVIAPDSFKGSLGAAEAAEALAAGWLSARPGDQVRQLPLADGGEGTLEVLSAGTRAHRWHQAEVTGPGGGRVASCWLELPGETHAVELARASGLPLLAAPDPMRAQTAGTGELIGRALDAGASRILVALGGSASTDGGTGALAALGARFIDASGQDLPPGGGGLACLACADLSGLRPPPPGGVTCLTDVRAPLLGPAGAAAAFGPQKGADASQIEVLEAGLARLAGQLGGQPDEPGAGAAGGTAFGLAAAWGAAIAAGAVELCRVAGLDTALAGADLVITGEGRYDATSTDGKVTGAVCAAAAAAGVPAALVAGQLADVPPAGVRLRVALADLAGGAAAAQREPGHWLAVASRTIALDIGEAAGPGGART
jgi:glycerate kinase